MSKNGALLHLKRKDKETGLHYNRFRYYDPHMARYISKDPIGLEGGINTSAYVADPTQWVDPLGLNGKKDNTQDAYETLKKAQEDMNKYNNIMKATLANQNGKQSTVTPTVNKTNQTGTAQNVSTPNWNPTVQRREVEDPSKVIERERKKYQQYSEIFNTANKAPSTSQQNVSEQNTYNFLDSVMTSIPQSKQPGGMRSRSVLGKNCTVCKEPVKADYLACNGSIAGVGTGFVKNLHAPKNEGWYVAGSKSSNLQYAVSPPKTPKDMASWSCAAGFIKDLDNERIKNSSRKDIVHEFVNGASYSYGGVAGTPLLGVGFNRVHPIVIKDSPVYGSHANEFVVGSSGVNVDFAITK